MKQLSLVIALCLFAVMWSPVFAEGPLNGAFGVKAGAFKTAAANLSAAQVSGVYGGEVPVKVQPIVRQRNTRLTCTGPRSVSLAYLIQALNVKKLQLTDGAGRSVMVTKKGKQFISKAFRIGQLKQQLSLSKITESKLQVRLVIDQPVTSYATCRYTAAGTLIRLY